MCEFFSSNVLDKNAHYTFRFTFNQEATKGGPKFAIGLICEEDKEKITDCNIFRYKEN